MIDGRSHTEAEGGKRKIETVSTFLQLTIGITEMDKRWGRDGRRGRYSDAADCGDVMMDDDSRGGLTQGDSERLHM